ncbi:MAG: insulinase family protein [Devosia sp.]|uniref:insulinase family protein n=1 Tax=Devosia sp. 66-22 TaxID=1895753 RepID=UPI000925A36E|nr:insulinase family protein [Devosia sp. 66-22]MBN9346855.1 insulinase family protein [Devosia sp.]OJX52617.1 MAG: peptidase M16 [Devosia sp. 66-22]
MSVHAAFDLVRDETIPEIASDVRLYRHKKTGAEVMSYINDDENKVFGITFKTPPEDSTGVAHILEHSVLCGSRKYPVKKPFVELIKSSMNTFLNAMTFPDKTAYPVASQNLQDFYNLVDVYLDAVFFPLISEDTFRQEGWHYEADGTQMPLAYKGVVFNEMKGAYSSPAALLGKVSQLSLYPDNAYGVNSGGDPKAIPDLTYDYFKNFHRRFYHPSNAKIVFYGDDPEGRRLEMLDEYLSQFDAAPVDATVKLQPRFHEPRHIESTYAATEAEPGKKTGMITVNWMLDEIEDPETVLALNVLEHVLVGTPAAPLRKALTDSGLGEGLTGSGLADDLRQPYFTVGLKGIDEGDGGKVETLVLDTLRKLAADGIDPLTIEASMNSFEFALRENNTGSFPRGMALMFRTMKNWLHGGDPFDSLTYEKPLEALKARVAAGEPVFETLVDRHLNSNTHRVTVLLRADTTQAEREVAEERERLDGVAEGLDEAGREDIVEITAKLKALQDTADPPEALAKIPSLGLNDLDRVNKPIPIERDTLAGARLYTHPLPTNGVIYLDLAFDLRRVPAELLPYLSLFSRALFQTGTAREDFVSLTQRIGRSTGGVGASRSISMMRDTASVAAWLFIRGKAVPDKADELLAIITDVLTSANLDNRERIKQMALEEKAGFESGIAGRGNGIAAGRLGASLNPASWANEQSSGVSYLFFLRELLKGIDNEEGWLRIKAALYAIRDLVIDRQSMVLNVTSDAGLWNAFRPKLEGFVAALPASDAAPRLWLPSTPVNEGLTFPGQVNYVAKGANLYTLGYEHTGATAVALRQLNTTYLWDKVRVQGGAYGGSASFDPFSGGFVFTSYRDPNLLETLAAYDGAAQWLKQGIGEQDLVRSIIGAIGAIDTYRLPDAKGFTSLMWELTGNTDENRQVRREQILDATTTDVSRFADVLGEVARAGQIVVLGSETAIKTANQERGGFLSVTKVL